MIFQDYRILTTRTLPDLGSSLITSLINSIHMVLGMGSELEELYDAIKKEDMVNIAEEFSDILWYAANYCNIHNINPGYYPFKSSQLDEDVDLDALNIVIKDIVGVISRLQDLDKKLLAYNRPVLHEQRKEAIESLLSMLHAAYVCIGINVEQSMQNNIDKLIARYPDKFSTYLANNRNLDAERVQLEKGL